MACRRREGFLLRKEFGKTERGVVDEDMDTFELGGDVCCFCDDNVDVGGGAVVVDVKGIDEENDAESPTPLFVTSVEDVFFSGGEGVLPSAGASTRDSACSGRALLDALLLLGLVRLINVEAAELLEEDETG